MATAHYAISKTTKLQLGYGEKETKKEHVPGVAEGLGVGEGIAFVLRIQTEK